ncbi:MAG: polysaccharide deacetylase family protein [Lactobacillus sp.]|jgi:peptidoglycan/xylan/chitin deacetylase (PgdA/CDA1 family)|nr:polysaccharide deacetylase family protein [Lactobacillus sp.]
MNYFNDNGGSVTFIQKTLGWKIAKNGFVPNDSFNATRFSPGFTTSASGTGIIKFYEAGTTVNATAPGSVILDPALPSVLAFHTTDDFWIFNTEALNDPTSNFAGRVIDCWKGENIYNTFKFGRHVVKQIDADGSYAIDNQGYAGMVGGIQQIDNVYFINVGGNQWVRRYDLSQNQTEWFGNANSFDDYQLAENLNIPQGASILSSVFVDEQTVVGTYDGSETKNCVEVNGRKYTKVSGGYVSDQPVMANIPDTGNNSGNGQFITLGYHDFSVSDTSNQIVIDYPAFKAQMDWIQNHGYHTLTEDEALGALLEGQSIPQNSVLLTFDDYYPSWTNPIGDNPSIIETLQNYGFSALLFLTIDKMTDSAWNDLRQLDKNQFAIGCHNVNHYPDAMLSGDDLITQVSDSKDTIEQELQIQVRSYAYPYGSRDDNTRLLLRKDGYKAGFNFGYGSGKESAAWDNYTHGVRENLLEKFNLTRVPINQDNKYTFDSIFS